MVPAATAALIAAMSLSITAVSADTAVVPAPGPRPLPAVATPLMSMHTAAPTTTRVSSRGGFTWPLSPRPAVLRLFEQPRTQWSRGHRGVDVLAAVGQPVLSAGEGVVAFSGLVAGRGVITVRHSGGLRTSYEPVDERLASGTVVHRGALIGTTSPTPGHCVPLTCLHWSAISGQTYQDPLSLLGFGRPNLLPLG